MYMFLTDKCTETRTFCGQSIARSLSTFRHARRPKPCTLPCTDQCQPNVLVIGKILYDLLPGKCTQVCHLRILGVAGYVHAECTSCCQTLARICDKLVYKAAPCRFKLLHIILHGCRQSSARQSVTTLFSARPRVCTSIAI